MKVNKGLFKGLFVSLMVVLGLTGGNCPGDESPEAPQEENNQQNQDPLDDPAIKAKLDSLNKNELVMLFKEAINKFVDEGSVVDDNDVTSFQDAIDENSGEAISNQVKAHFENSLQSNDIKGNKAARNNIVSIRNIFAEEVRSWPSQGGNGAGETQEMSFEDFSEKVREVSEDADWVDNYLTKVKESLQEGTSLQEIARIKAENDEKIIAVLDLVFATQGEPLKHEFPPTGNGGKVNEVQMDFEEFAKALTNEAMEEGTDDVPAWVQGYLGSLKSTMDAIEIEEIDGEKFVTRDLALSVENIDEVATEAINAVFDAQEKVDAASDEDDSDELNDTDNNNPADAAQPAVDGDNKDEDKAPEVQPAADGDKPEPAAVQPAVDGDNNNPANDTPKVEEVD